MIISLENLLNSPAPTTEVLVRMPEKVRDRLEACLEKIVIQPLAQLGRFTKPQPVEPEIEQKIKDAINSKNTFIDLSNLKSSNWSAVTRRLA